MTFLVFHTAYNVFRNGLTALPSGGALGLCSLAKTTQMAEHIIPSNTYTPGDLIWLSRRHSGDPNSGPLRPQLGTPPSDIHWPFYNNLVCLFKKMENNTIQGGKQLK